MDGVLRCSRYSFGPNRLHYCGPDKTREIYDYIKEGAEDFGLNLILKEFKTLYPYLCFIAAANNVKDPFNSRVVEAYWIGNELLENAAKKKFYRHLLEEQKIKKLIGREPFEIVIDKIISGAIPHHSFHVLNIWRRTGNLDIAHNLESMDKCRVSWGKVTGVDGPFIMVNTQSLEYENEKIKLGETLTKKVIRNLESYGDIADVKKDDIISIHWDIPCEVITQKQAANLKKYTALSISLANKELLII